MCCARAVCKCVYHGGKRGQGDLTNRVLKLAQKLPQDSLPFRLCEPGCTAPCVMCCTAPCRALHCTRGALLHRIECAALQCSACVLPHRTALI